MTKEQREKRKAYQRKWYAENRDRVNSYSRNWSKKHPEQRKETRRKYRQNNLEKVRKHSRELMVIKRKEWRDAVLNHYGKECACCGEINQYFLTIDHVENNGAEHRKKLNIPKGGSSFYGWLVRNDFPKGFQTLCMNCNWGKRYYGVCPHHILEPSETIPKGSRVKQPEARSIPRNRDDDIVRSLWQHKAA